MANMQQYPRKDFSTQQTFLAYDPSQGTVRVSGQDIVDSIDLGTPIQLLQAEVNERVQYFRTTDLALLADLPISRVIYTTGASAENDGLGAHFVVVAAGTPNSLPMTNGNALLQLEFISQPMTYINSVANIAGFTGAVNDQQISLKGWHPDSDVGSGTLYWDADKPKADHNGGTVFSPTVPFGTVADYLDGVGETDPAGSGCWVRLLDGFVTPEMFGGDIDATPRRMYKSDPQGVAILKIRDRLFIGDGVESSGSRTATANESWLTSQLGAHYLERAAQTLSLSQSGKYGGVFATRSSDQQDFGMVSETAVAVAGVCINDNTPDGLGWAGYFEANRDAGKGTVFGAEFALKNKGSDVINTPFNKFGGAGATIGTWFAGGGDAAYYGAPANPSTAAILIGKNSAPWNKGIVFDAEGIAGTDGVTGEGRAISLANGHKIDWFSSNTNIGFSVWSKVDDTQKNMEVIAFNSFLTFNSTSNDQPLFNITNVTNPASYIAVTPKSDATAPTVEAKGGAANIDIRIKPKGGGLIQFGYSPSTATTPSNFTADFRLPIKGEDGTIYYIPARASQW